MVYDIDMSKEIGFSKGLDGVYTSRPSIHMDCLWYVFFSCLYSHTPRMFYSYAKVLKLLGMVAYAVSLSYSCIPRHLHSITNIPHMDCLCCDTY